VQQVISYAASCFDGHMVQNLQSAYLCNSTITELHSMQLLRGAAGKVRPRLLARCAMSAVASPPEVIVRQENGLGRLTLARSKQLNALGAGTQWQFHHVSKYRSSS
jgi:hypothetical protein